MKTSISTRIICIILALAICFQPLAAPIRAKQTFYSLINRWGEGVASAQAKESGIQGVGNQQVYLPLIAVPPGPPDFEIISPMMGWTVGGMMFFATQARNPKTVTSMTFLAGSTSLGTDSTPADGFKVFFDASTFPVGDLTLTATGHGPGGEMSKTVIVNIVSDPPSSGTIGSEGGVLSSEIGSLLTIPPGSLPNETFVSVDEMTQEEVTVQNGIDWESIGVTFLGQQNIQSNAPFALPYQVASADYGNRVQPGQAVVQYQMVPDVDGDGADEIVVVNTASVAPNDDVISDPIPQVLLEETAIVSGMSYALGEGSGSGISGPPGMVIEMNATGFNPSSIMGNVAIFHSEVDGSELTIPVGVIPTSDGAGQTVMIIIPPMTTGLATVTLRNESTGFTTEPMMITIEESPSLEQPAIEIIEETLDASLTAIDEIAALAAAEGWDDLVVSANQVNVQMSAFLDIVQEISIDPTVEEEQFLHNLAVMFVTSDAVSQLSSTGTLLERTPQTDCVRQAELIAAMILVAFVIVAMGIIGGPLTLVGMLAISSGAGVLAFSFTYARELAKSECPGMLPPPPCSPSQTAGGGGGNSDAGLGSVVASGGGACGCGLKPPAQALAPLEGRFGQGSGGLVVKIYSAGSPIPFTGVTDPGGYFFIPIIPAGEPFTAIAYDLASGETRTIEGIGPEVGDSVFLYFDFFSEQPDSDTAYWDGGGDGISWHDPWNWNPDALPGPTQHVIIDVPGDVTVVHSNVGLDAIFTLQSAEALVLSGGTLDITGNSVLSNTLTLNGGMLSGTGDVTVGGMFTWAYGIMAGSGTTIANGGITFSGSNNNGRYLFGRALQNTGTAVFQEGVLTAYSGAVITNQPGAVFDFQGDLTLYSSTGGATFDNLGTVIKSVGNGTMHINTSFNNSGMVDVQTGTLNLTGGGTHSGTFEGSGTLEFGGGSHTLDGTLTNINVLVSFGLFAMNGSYDTPDTTLTGGTFTTNIGRTANSQTLTLNGGTLSGGGDMAVSGPLTWVSGTMSGAGTTIANGGITFSGNNGRTLDTRSLENSGLATFQDGFLTAFNGATITNLPGATFDFQGDDNLYTSTGGATFTNLGVVTKSAGSGTMSIFPAFVNSGSVGVQAGELEFRDDFTQTAAGTLFVQIGGLTPITDFDQFNISGDAVLDGTLDVTLINGFVPNSGDIFEVLTFATRTGQFVTINGHGQGYTVNYNAMDLTLIAQ